MHGNAERGGLDLGHSGRKALRGVALVEDDDRPGAALPARREIALEAPKVEVVAEGADDEDDVDVRRDHLLGDLLSRRLARERGRPLEDGVHGRGRGVGRILDGHPVADRQEIRRGDRGMPAGRRPGQALAVQA